MDPYLDVQRGPFTVWAWVIENCRWQPKECATLEDVYDVMRICELSGCRYRVTRDVEFTVDWPGHIKSDESEVSPSI